MLIRQIKNNSLFNLGMKPAVLSLKSRSHWQRSGSVRYDQTDVPRENGGPCYYSLTIDIQPFHEADTLFLAHSQPYSFSKLNSFLREYLGVRLPGSTITRSVLCQSVGGHPVYMLEVGSSRLQHREAVVFLARQHPGQTPGSFVCEGVLKSIVSKHKLEAQLRQHYQIFVIPMVNPDGVVFGNYRCNFSGSDLNRKWQTPSRLQQPEVYYVKKKILELSKKYKIRFVIDLHGHSKKLGAFFYSNKEPSDQVRLLPMIASELTDKVVYSSCTFESEESKQSTARIQLAHELPDALVYTFEVSFYGYRRKNGTIKEFEATDLRDLGRELVRSISEFTRMKADGQLTKTSIMLLSKYGEANDHDSGSESRPDLFELNDRQIEFLNNQFKPEEDSPKRPKSMLKLTSEYKPKLRKSETRLGVRPLEVKPSVSSIKAIDFSYEDAMVESRSGPIKNSLQNYRLTGLGISLKPRKHGSKPKVSFEQ